MKDRIEAALWTFGIDGRIIGSERGPTVTRYRLDLSGRSRVAQVERLANDLALRLGAQSIRVIVEDGSLGLEIPNDERSAVSLADVRAAAPTASGLPMYLGKSATGEPMVEDLARAPHLLIAGTTGSGKSVCINAILASLLDHAPAALRLCLIDPKQVELAPYGGIPHLIAPVVVDMAEAAAAVAWAADEMERRYTLLADSGCRDLASYNARAEPLPRIVYIVDEMADLMMMYGASVEPPIVRIAQKARAVGIHLILSTQRPSADVITGLIKSNIPSRIAFRVNSGTDSRIILDTMGAEKLLGLGDMLSLNSRGHLTRGQGLLISDDEIAAIVRRAMAMPRAAALLSAADDEASEAAAISPEAREAIRGGCALMATLGGVAAVGAALSRLWIP